MQVSLNGYGIALRKYSGDNWWNVEIAGFSGEAGAYKESGFRLGARADHTVAAVEKLKRVFSKENAAASEPAK